MFNFLIDSTDVTVPVFYRKCYSDTGLHFRSQDLHRLIRAPEEQKAVRYDDDEQPYDAFNVRFHRGEAQR